MSQARTRDISPHARNPSSCLSRVARSIPHNRQLMLMVMKEVVGTDVIMIEPGKWGVTAIYLHEELRLEKALMSFRIAGTVAFIAGGRRPQPSILTH